MNDKNITTIYLLGDSITQGLGSKKLNFTGVLAKLLGKNYRIVNLAYTGTTISYALKLLDNGKLCAPPGGSFCVCRTVRECRCADTAEPHGQGISSYPEAFPRRWHADAEALLFSFIG